MYTLPGTVIECRDATARQLISSLFSAGGLVLSQVCNITGLEGHMVQNWVKRGFLSPPKDKKYTKRQLCRIIIINMLKDVLSLPQITQLITYVNGRLDDERDDIIDDSELYFYFVDLVGLMGENFTDLEVDIKKITSDCTDRAPREVARIENALKVFAAAYFSAESKKKALFYMNRIE